MDLGDNENYFDVALAGLRDFVPWNIGQGAVLPFRSAFPKRYCELKGQGSGRG